MMDAQTDHRNKGVPAPAKHVIRYTVITNVEMRAATGL